MPRRRGRCLQRGEGARASGERPPPRARLWLCRRLAVLLRARVGALWHLFRRSGCVSSQGRRKNPQLLAILRDRSPCDDDPPACELVSDLLIGQGRGLACDQFLDDIHHAERGREKVAEGDDLAGRQHHVLRGGSPTDGGLVHAEMVGHCGPGERLQVANSVEKEVLLGLDDVLGDLLEGLAPLIDIGDEELRARDILSNVAFLVVGEAVWLLLQASRELLIEGGDAQKETLRLDDLDLKGILLGLGDDHVGQDNGRAVLVNSRIWRSIALGWIGIQPSADELARLVHLLKGKPQLAGDLIVLVLSQLLEMRADDGRSGWTADPLTFEVGDLNQKALPQIARADADWFE